MPLELKHMQIIMIGASRRGADLHHTLCVPTAYHPIRSIRTVASLLMASSILPSPLLSRFAHTKAPPPCASVYSERRHRPQVSSLNNHHTGQQKRCPQMTPIMAPRQRAIALSAATSTSPHHRWKLEVGAKALRPEPGETDRLIDFLADRVGDDLSVRFIFSEGQSARELSVHQSRLEWAGGAMASIAKDKQEDVRLGFDDDARSFGVVRRYLYEQEVDLDHDVVELMQIVQVAYRWELAELVRGVCEYVRGADLLSLDDEEVWVSSILKAAGVIALPEIERGFVTYFWECVGRRFDNFRAVNGRKTWGEGNGTGGGTGGMVEGEGWTGFPGLWDLAYAQGMVKRVMQCAVGRVGEETMREFLEVVLVYLEPRMRDDEEVAELLGVLGAGVGEYRKRVLTEGILDRECSVRAMRLLANCEVGNKVGRVKRGAMWGVRRVVALPMQLVTWRAVQMVVRWVREGHVDVGWLGGRLRLVGARIRAR